jgi:aspartate racemase
MSDARRAHPSRTKRETVLAMTPARPLQQKTIGLLGGMSNQSTAEYYRLINERLNGRLGGWDNGEIVIVSVNFGNIEHFIRRDQWDAAQSYLAAKMDALERAGADVILCVSNTMHRVVAPIMAQRATPFIHIADPTGEAIRRAGLKRVGLLGTLPVMRSAELASRYRDRFGIEIVVPPDPDREVVDRIIFDELVRGDICARSKTEYLRIIGELAAAGAQGVILGCTEIFLLVGQDDLPDVPVFDTTALHVDAAVNFALAPD